ncbi:ferritin-like domain-containing protein [Hymenobacter weizhouensis]|uniref:ferritin-like domain-containing protein n=1 Tax=Hymenobacter sp. YIM 151500-1 TaxID=2987689 RepID=UPI00222658EB|nr:PA2169 family four-helix-bundle protein [Hymenobacter sp. YIM 151500-1]UYZ64959.1 PA2169 family four-helix-bundle protein [Hymenobacter sp. YIM 151500-1]
MNQPQNQPQSSNSTSQSGNDLLSQAQQWLNQGSLNDLLNQASPALKNVGNQALTRFNKLSTTQKVVGGALLALGALYLTSQGKGSGTQKKQDQASTLNELLYFVNDRIEGYQRAVEESKDPQLSGYYKQLVSQSQRFANELNDYLRQQGGDRQTSTTLKGKFYRGWMDAKAAITGRDEKAILGSNIYGEEWALKAYEEALDDHTLTGAMRQAVERQYKLSQKTYQELQRLADKQE